jgi:hypothetical protein
MKILSFPCTDFRNSHFMRLRVLQNLRAKGFLAERLEWVDQRLDQALWPAPLSGGPADPAIAQPTHSI